MGVVSSRTGSVIMRMTVETALTNSAVPTPSVVRVSTPVTTPGVSLSTSFVTVSMTARMQTTATNLLRCVALKT